MGRTILLRLGIMGGFSTCIQATGVSGGALAAPPVDSIDLERTLSLHFRTKRSLLDDDVFLSTGKRIPGIISGATCSIR